jgi:putative (di)nucleoside polyphosphate hydrolase
VIDTEGYRANVGIILSQDDGRVFWARRIGQDAWQFPQGGIQEGETHEQALYRELEEEVGLRTKDVEVIGCTKGWLKYHLPKHLIRHDSLPLCIGQKQVWYLLRLLTADNKVCLDTSEKPEFDHWRWVEYWKPARDVVSFKRKVYLQALKEFHPLLFPDQQLPELKYRRGPHGFRR